MGPTALHPSEGRRAEDCFARLPLYGAGIKEAVALYQHHTSLWRVVHLSIALDSPLP
jgi:hypothetical protein